MKFEMFINFNGNCREAVEFYARVFKSEVKNLMTYAQMPHDPKCTCTGSCTCTVSESDKNKIMYAGIPVGNMTLMFMDMPSNEPFICGNNISPTISTDDIAEVKRLFNGLKEGGKAEMDLQKTFYSELYGMVTDKFGVTWQVLHSTGQW